MLLTLHVILTIAAVGALARWPTRARSAVAIAAAAVAAVALGAPVAPALGLAAPLLAFLGAALTLSALVARSGLVERAADALAACAGGSTLALYALVCALCALLTAAVSLDGAVVLMVPLLLALTRRSSVPLAPLFVGVVSVANVASIAVPQGNPTNLVLIERLGISPGAYLGHMLVPGLVATALTAAVVACTERRALAARYSAPRPPSAGLTRRERHAAIALVAAAASASVAPLLGIAPWWPLVAVVAVALAASRERPRVTLPWRTVVQVTGLLIVLGSLALTPAPIPDPGLPALLAVAAAVGAAAAIANNLPVSLSVATLLAGPCAYAASIGLAIGSLATPHGSIATLIARDLAGPHAPAHPTRLLAPLAVAAVLVATPLAG
jgi:arsenical pump membrane protein